MDNYTIQVLISLLAEMSAEVRSRREPESVLTAAFVAAAGAVAWGVAAISSTPIRKYWLHPAIAGSIGIAVLAVFIITKVIREYRTYESARLEQGQLAQTLVQQINTRHKIRINLPHGLEHPQAQHGHIYSITIIIAAAFAAVFFCLSIFLI